MCITDRSCQFRHLRGGIRCQRREVAQHYTFLSNLVLYHHITLLLTPVLLGALAHKVLLRGITVANYSSTLIRIHEKHDTYDKEADKLCLNLFKLGSRVCCHTPRRCLKPVLEQYKCLFKFGSSQNCFTSSKGSLCPYGHITRAKH